MVSGLQLGVPCTSLSDHCVDKLGCPSNICPNFTIKRHDTKPPFKVSIEDCDGPLDLATDIQDDLIVVEVNMWAKAKLKTVITNIDTYFALADGIGFEQVMQGDIIIMERARRPEHMLVIGFDETNCFIRVQRGYNGTTASEWKKGTPMKIFRILNGIGSIESELDDIIQEDGTTLKDQLIETFLVNEWTPNSTCLAGCYWLEFKLLKMNVSNLSMFSVSGVSVTPSFTPSTWTASADFGCVSGEGVEWERRFPADGEGFLIKIVPSPTTEF